MQNVTVAASWVYGGKYTGGLVGLNVGTIENSKNSASISGSDECVGGIVGNSSQKNINTILF